MAESKVVSIRVPQDLLDAIDRLAAKRYPSRRPDGDPNRSQLILDALEAFVENSDDTVKIFHTVSSPEKIDARVTALVDERLASLQDKIAALEDQMEKQLAAPDNANDPLAVDEKLALIDGKLAILESGLEKLSA